MHHAAVLDEHGLPGFVIMAESRLETIGIEDAKMTTAAFETTSWLHCQGFVKNGKPIPSKAELIQSMQISDDVLFNPDTGLVRQLLHFAPSNRVRLNKEVGFLDKEFKESVQSEM